MVEESKRQLSNDADFLEDGTLISQQSQILRDNDPTAPEYSKIEWAESNQSQLRSSSAAEPGTDGDALYNELKVGVFKFAPITKIRFVLEHCRKWFVHGITQPSGHSLFKDQLAACAFQDAQPAAADTDLHVHC